MNEKIKKIMKMAAFLLTAAVFMICLVFAADSPRILQYKIPKTSDNRLVFYLLNPSGSGLSKASVGRYQSENAYMTADSSATQVITWLLYDNSVSIPAEDRQKALRLMQDLVDGRSGSNERFILCTFSEHLNIRMDENSDYADVKASIANIETYDQETYLTDVISELMNWESNRYGTEYVRIVVISDGVDNNPQGITRRELNDRLDRTNFPIYTIGCGSDTQRLKEMYELSRRTGGREWSFQDMSDTLGVVSAMRSTVPLRAEVEIPEEAREGGEKTVRLTFEDKSYAEYKNVPVTLDENKSIPSESWHLPGWLLPLFLILIVLVAVGGGLYWLIAVKKIKPFRHTGKQNWSDIDDDTPTDHTEDDDSPTEAEGENTDHLIEQKNIRRTHTLRLIGLENAEEMPDRIQCTFTQSLVLGRSRPKDSKEAFLRLAGGSISRQHCRITAHGNRYEITDLNASRHTYLDDIELEPEKPAELFSGSTLKLGRVKFRVEIDTDS